MAQVSVVIPVYNIAAHLRQCLDSVVGQSLQDIEIICVDDGSTDESYAILEEYVRQDPRIRVIRQENAGPGVARNTGLQYATGEYLIFLDSDDWFEKDFLELMLRRARETDADVTICTATEFDTNTGKELPSEWMLKVRLLPGDVFSPREAADCLFQFTYGWPWDKLYRRSFVSRAELSYPPLRNSEDLAFVFHSVAAADRIAILHRSMIHHRVNRAESVSNSRKQAPDVPYRAMLLLRDRLKEGGLYEYCEQSFMNWAMDFLVWNAANMGDRAAQKAYLGTLKKEWLPAMEFDRYPASYYTSRTVYAKYLLARFAPSGLFVAVVALYKKAKRILRRE